MGKKNKKDDFFDQMLNYKIDRFNRFNLIIMISLIFSGLLFGILCAIFFTNTRAINNASMGVLWVSIAGIVLSCLSELIYLILINSAEFMSGKLSNGLANFAISIIVVVAVILIVNSAIPEEIKPLLPAIIAAVATFFAAILALMGIHYTTTKKQEERMYKNRLVFAKDEIANATDEYVLQRHLDGKSIDICIKNISENFGFLCGIFRVCGCEVYAIEDKPSYFPLAPRKSYVIKGINYNVGDDQLILIYKDIEDKYYYIHLRVISSFNFEIIKINLCDMSFLHNRLEVTKRMEEKLKSKKKKTIIAKPEVVLEESISLNKENTKPIFTKYVNGYELIMDESGNDLTDRTLLEKLRKERLSISKENKVKEYIIFNNQQLVAMATYKPIDYVSFISIYGLGEGKYTLYGERFLEIIKKHIS